MVGSAAEPGPVDAVKPAQATGAEATSPGGGWRLPLLVGLALAIVTAVPYAYAYAVQPHGQVFMGFFYLGDDANTYLAQMRQGWEGSWAWTNRYTTESSPSAYLFMFWILLGHVAAILHLPLIAVFHGARVAAAFALAAAAWGALLAEMTSLQMWAATRAIPVAFGLEMAVPAALAPFLTQRQPPHAVAFVLGLALACAGAIALGSSRAVARAAVPLTEP